MPGSTTAASPDLEIVDHDGVVNEREFTTGVYVDALIENRGNAPSGPVELTAQWYDSDGNYRGNDSTYLRALRADETWAARVSYLGSEADVLHAYDFDGEYETNPPSFDPEGLELVDHTMEVIEGEGSNEVRITGRVANNRDSTVDYLEAIGAVYNADGYVLGDEWTNVTDIPVGETWAFEIRWSERDRTTEATDHVVSITDS
jgi:hypothetical protein